jgi:putative oxidoreductase
MSAVGIGFAPVFWGFMAACAESFGALSLLLGLCLRPFTILMLITMAVAATMHLKRGDGFAGASHAMEMAAVFLGLLISGGGALSLGRAIRSLRGKWYI